MAKCPSCHKRLKFKQVIQLSNSKALTCPGCGSVLKASSVKNSAIGGIGALSAFALYKAIPDPTNYIVVAAFFAVLSVFYFYWVPLENENT